MNVFTIDSGNNIAVHASKKAARQTGASLFDSAESLAGLIGPDNQRLIGIWNSLTGVTPVQKFSSRTVAVRRIFAEVRKLAAPAAADALTEPVDETPAARRAPRTPVAGKVAKKAKAERTGSRKEIVLGLISRHNGATLEELMAALNWQKHSVRGFIATLGKTVDIESFRTEQGIRTYKTS